MTFARIHADWPAPSSIVAFSTCRQGGFSHGPYHSLNFGLSVGDELTSVQHNRNLLQQEFKEPLFWLHQIHSAQAIELSPDLEVCKADAIYTQLKNRACIVKTADCLPILITNKAGTEIAAIHAGWRCLAGGIIRNTLSQLKSPPQELLVWFGPAISQAAFEIGPEVREAFLAVDAGLEHAFMPGKDDRYHADLVAIAKHFLKECHVTDTYGGDLCTYSEPDKFFSYRRDKVTGRMASVICIT